MVEIVEAYSDFDAPCDARAGVAELLDTVPAQHLNGLGHVLLTNAAALKGARKRGRSWSRGRKVKHSAVAGLYHAAWRGQPASIELLVVTYCACPADEAGSKRRKSSWRPASRACARSRAGGRPGWPPAAPWSRSRRPEPRAGLRERQKPPGSGARGGVRAG